jgi:hypothetical protein
MSPVTVAYALHTAYGQGDFLGFVRIFREAEPNLPYETIRENWEKVYNVHKECFERRKGFP